MSPFKGTLVQMVDEGLHEPRFMQEAEQKVLEVKQTELECVAVPDDFEANKDEVSAEAMDGLENCCSTVRYPRTEDVMKVRAHGASENASR